MLDCFVWNLCRKDIIFNPCIRALYNRG